MKRKRAEKNQVLAATKRKAESLGKLSRPKYRPSLIVVGAGRIQLEFEPDYGIGIFAVFKATENGGTGGGARHRGRLCS